MRVITDVDITLKWILGFDGGTIFSLTGTSPSANMPDPWTNTSKKDMQLIHEFVWCPAATTIEAFAADRDPEPVAAVPRSRRGPHP